MSCTALYVAIDFVRSKELSGAKLAMMACNYLVIEANLSELHMEAKVCVAAVSVWTSVSVTTL